MPISHESDRTTAAPEPLTLVRRLYDAWNAGDVAGAAELLAPDVQWESFHGSRPLSGPGAIQATLAGPSGGTWRLAPVGIDLLVGVGDHVIAVSRRGGAEPSDSDRLEVWTLRDGRAVHYRGFPLDTGMAVLSETTRSHKLEAVCRAVLAFNRGDAEGWMRFFVPDIELVSAMGERGGFRLRGSPEDFAGRRIEDVRIVAESFEALVVSATVHERNAGSTLSLFISFAGTRARRIVHHATPEDALDAAAARRFDRPPPSRP